MNGRKLSVLLGVLCLVAASEASASPGAALRKTGEVKVKSGYIDAHFAVSPNGKMLAYVHVGERNLPTYLTVVSLQGSRRRLARVNITPFTDAPVRLDFTPDSKRVVVIGEVAVRGSKRPQQAAFYDLTGRQVGKISGFAELVMRPAKAGGDIVVYARTALGQRVTHTVSLYNATTLRRTKTSQLVTSLGGEVTRPKMTIAYFTPDFSRIVVRVAGAYDRKSDVRLPDREKVYDPFTRKFVSDREISNLREWESVRKIRAENQRLHAALLLGGTQKNFTWELINHKNERVTLADTAPPLKWFNFKSLNQQLPPRGTTLLFSFTVDPQWPTLFGRQRNVPEVLHLFRLDLATRRTALLGTIPCPGQVVQWRLGGTKLVIIRMHQYWQLGHRAIEIYDVPAAK